MPTSKSKAKSKRKTSDYHHGDLRETLIAAALVKLGTDGDPASLSLRETARHAGVSAMAPYRHFADKEALLAAVAEVGFARLTAALTAADRAQDPAEALIGQGVAYVAFACAEPALFRLMFGTALSGRHDALAEAGRRAYAVMSDRVASLPARVDAGDWALRCWATAHGLASLFVDGQLAEHDETPLVLADRILRIGAMRPIDRERR